MTDQERRIAKIERWWYEEHEPEWPPAPPRDWSAAEMRVASMWSRKIADDMVRETMAMKFLRQKS